MNSAEWTPMKTTSGHCLPRNAFRFTAGTPTYFASSPGVRPSTGRRVERSGTRPCDGSRLRGRAALLPEVTALDRLGLHDQRLRRAAKRLVAADARQRDGEFFDDFVERGAALLQQGRARRALDQPGRVGAHARAAYLDS